MFRKLAVAGAITLAVAGIAWAANAPLYHDSEGVLRRSEGVTLIDKDTGEPYNATGGGGGGGDASAANQVVTNTEIGGLTEAAPGTDTASSGLNGRLQRIAQRLTTLLTTQLDINVKQVSGANVAVGGGAAATAIRIAQATDDTVLGATNETAPATDTATSGLNGRAQRVAQNVTTMSAKLPASLGAKTGATSLSVVQSTDNCSGVSVSLARTNDTNAYTANDVIGTATGSTAALTFANFATGAGEYTIDSVSLEIDATAVISGETSYRLYLYSVTPPSALGDNAAFDIPSGDRAAINGMGYVDLGTPVDLGSTLYVQVDGLAHRITPAGTSIFAYLVTNGAYTPTASRVYVTYLHGCKAS